MPFHFDVSTDNYTLRVSSHASVRLRERMGWRSTAKQRHHAEEVARKCACHHWGEAPGARFVVEVDDVLWCVVSVAHGAGVVTTAMPAYWRQGVYAMEEWLKAGA